MIIPHSWVYLFIHVQNKSALTGFPCIGWGRWSRKLQNPTIVTESHEPLIMALCHLGCRRIFNFPICAKMVLQESDGTSALSFFCMRFVQRGTQRPVTQTGKHPMFCPYRLFLVNCRMEGTPRWWFPNNREWAIPINIFIQINNIKHDWTYLQ